MPKPEQVDLTKLYNMYEKNTRQYPKILNILSEDLNISTTSLRNLGVGFYPGGQCWIFPERDSKGNIIGLLRRFFNGKKFMVEGSKRGLIYATNKTDNTDIYTSGKDNWVRVSASKPCPLCGKSDGCLLPAKDTVNPPAVVCVHISEGAVKSLNLGYLHILDPQRNNVSKSSLLCQAKGLPILVVEGATDVLAAMDLGFTAIGRPSAEGGIELLKSLVAGRNVVIVGDNDAGAGKAGMDKAFHILKEKCKSTIKVLPPEGIKDFRQWKNDGLTQKKFMEYVKTTGDSTETPDIFGDDIAHTVAKTWLRNEKIKNGVVALRKYKGEWYEFKDTSYNLIEDESFRGGLYSYLADKSFYRIVPNGDVVVAPYKPTRAKIADILDALNQWCPVAGEPPVWIAGDHKLDPSRLIVFQNGILDVDKYVLGKGTCMYNATPELFTTNVLPYNFIEDINSCLWEDFLHQIFNDDEKKISLLSQWFGYNCVCDMSFEKLMLFTGRPRSGKGTVLDAMQSMLGKNQCCQTSFQSLIGPFGYQPLLNKLSALIGDAKSPRSGEASAVLEKILQITGGDAVSVNRKGVSQIPSVRLKCRFTIVMNDLPAFTDHARALEPRLNLLVFNNSYEGSEDRTLKRRLKSEAMQGKLINFALRGLRELYTNKQFTEPDDSKETLKDFRRIATPAFTFVEECCDMLPPGSDKYVTKSQIYDIWRGWCLDQGRKPGFKEQFSRWFTGACRYAKINRIRIGDERVYVYTGIRIKESAFRRYMGK